MSPTRVIPVASSSSASQGNWTCFSRTHSLKSPRKHQANDEVSDNGDSIYDWEIDCASDSSTLLSSRCLSPSFTYQPLDETDNTLTEFKPAELNSTKRGFRFSLHEPGERTLERTLRLRARTADVIGSLPETIEDIIDTTDHGSSSGATMSYACENASSPTLASSSSKLRRISGRVNLRDSFYRSGRSQPPSFGDSQSETSETSSERDLFVPPAHSLSSVTAYSSADTLVDFGIRVYPNRNSTAVLRECVASKTYSAFLPASTSHALCPSHNWKSASSPRPPSHHGTYDRDRSREYPVWSCAKIAQSTIKHAARRGHTSRKSRIISNAVLIALAFPL